MQRLTKEEMKQFAQLGIPGAYVMPGSDESPIETSCNMLFPPDIENRFPMHRGAIIAMRQELRWELTQSLSEGNPENVVVAMMTMGPYLKTIYDLCGEEAYLDALSNTSYAQKLRSNLQHNSKMLDKLKEYQERACGACGKLGPWKRCSRCRQIHYCKTECQKSHWSTHKVHCKKQSKDKLGSKSTQEKKNDGVLVQPVDPPGCFVIVDDPVIYLAPVDHPIMTKFQAKYGEPRFRYIHDGTTYNTMSEEEYFGCKA